MSLIFGGGIKELPNCHKLKCHNRGEGDGSSEIEANAEALNQHEISKSF